ncbi:MAG: NAD(P)-dependent oxidoreductase [Blastococcus sp.]|jgi:UDP-glucose 4-epimerase|nr:NAD(P)-dependent oxidoreductase [Blastococcus sp.]
MSVGGERVLVTGGTGLIGSRVARALLGRGATPVLLDVRPDPGTIAGIADRVLLEAGDVTDAATLLRICREQGITRVVHLAALLTLDTGRDPVESIRTNCIGTANVFGLAAQHDLRRILWTSTAGVYGPRPFYERLLGRHTVDEDDPVAPYDVYGGTKQLCEVLARRFTRDGADIVGLRPVMTFGVGRLPGAVGVLTDAIRDAALRGHGVVGRPWSAAASINPMYVEDCADLIVRAVLHDEPLQRTVYNMGTGEYHGLQAMAEMALAAMPAGARLEFGDPGSGPAAHVPEFDYPDVDSTRLRAELDWTPGHDFRSAVAECVDIFRSEG